MWFALMSGESTRLDHMVKGALDIPESCAWVTFLRNHDEISLRTLGVLERRALIDYVDPERRYMFGEFPAVRIASIYNGDREKILRALNMLYSLPGSPVMYYGDEIGMRNLPVEKDILDTRRYVRGTFDREVAKLQMQDAGSLFNEVAQIVQAEAPGATSSRTAIPGT
jgi:glycosidase